jgi:hypothetical protein
MRAYIGPEHLRRQGGGCKFPFWTLYGETGDPDPYIYTAENYDSFPSIPSDGDKCVILGPINSQTGIISSHIDCVSSFAISRPLMQLRLVRQIYFR